MVDCNFVFSVRSVPGHLINMFLWTDENDKLFMWLRKNAINAYVAHTIRLTGGWWLMLLSAPDKDHQVGCGSSVCRGLGWEVKGSLFTMRKYSILKGPPYYSAVGGWA